MLSHYDPGANSNEPMFVFVGREQYHYLVNQNVAWLCQNGISLAKIQELFDRDKEVVLEMIKHPYVFSLHMKDRFDLAISFFELNAEQQLDLIHYHSSITRLVLMTTCCWHDLFGAEVTTVRRREILDHAASWVELAKVTQWTLERLVRLSAFQKRLLLLHATEVADLINGHLSFDRLLGSSDRTLFQFLEYSANVVRFLQPQVLEGSYPELYDALFAMDNEKRELIFRFPQSIQCFVNTNKHVTWQDVVALETDDVSRLVLGLDVPQLRRLLPEDQEEQHPPEEERPSKRRRF